MYNEYHNVQAAFLDNLYALRNGQDGANTVTVKDKETKELLHRQFRILQPEQRVMLLRNRNDNIFAKIAETLWVLDGRDDMEFLSHYLPRAPQWADDGKHWRAAYGPRLRQWTQCGAMRVDDGWGDDYWDQIAQCVKLLQRDPQSRQAVITLWDPAADWVESKDIPCNNWLHFLIRDNQLHLAVAVRSNDILWGFSGINFFEWSVLHEAMAHWLNVELGQISWFASSLHLYEQHYTRAEQILRTNNMFEDSLYDFDIPHVAWDTEFYALDIILHQFFVAETQIRYSCALGWPGHIQNGANAFIHTCLQMLTIYNAHLQGKKSIIVEALNDMPASDFRVAGIEYMVRQYGHDFLQSVSLSSAEEQFFSYYYRIS